MPVVPRLHNLHGRRSGILFNMYSPDDIDRSILRVLRDKPRTPVTELARLANVARGTAQARLDRMESAGVITGYGPEIDRTAVGYAVLAFATLEIAQGHDRSITAHLASIPEVLEVHAVTGTGDLLCKVVARSNEHLHEVLQSMLAADGIRRTETHLALHTRLHRTEVDLLISHHP